MLAHLDRHERSGGDIDAWTAELFRNVEAIEAHLSSLLDESGLVIGVEFTRIRIEVGLERNDFFLHIPPHGVHDQLLLITQHQVH